MKTQPRNIRLDNLVSGALAMMLQDGFTCLLVDDRYHKSMEDFTLQLISDHDDNSVRFRCRRGRDGRSVTAEKAILSAMHRGLLAAGPDLSIFYTNFINIEAEDILSSIPHDVELSSKLLEAWKQAGILAKG